MTLSNANDIDNESNLYAMFCMKNGNKIALAEAMVVANLLSLSKISDSVNIEKAIIIIEIICGNGVTSANLVELNDNKSIKRSEIGLPRTPQPNPPFEVLAISST